eukprot:1195368-Prorocentrum_minimum.AAC.1
MYSHFRGVVQRHHHRQQLLASQRGHLLGAQQIPRVHLALVGGQDRRRLLPLDARLGCRAGEVHAPVSAKGRRPEHKRETP